MEPSLPSNPFALRRLIPAVLALVLLLDVGSRLVSYDAVAFRAWEALTSHAFVQRAWQALRDQPPATFGSFRPNQRYESDAAYGDLSARSNRRWMRQVHREVFTTDALGLRNLEPLTEPRIAVIVGSSFTVGSTLNDDETLSAQLAPLLGGKVYNAGSALTDEASLDDLFDRLNLAPGATLIFESLEKNEPPPLGTPGARRSLVMQMAFADMDIWLAASPFRIALWRAHATLEDDAVMPNGTAKAAELGRFPNGDAILFLPEDRAVAENRNRSSQAGIPYWRHLNDHLARRGMNLLVLLVPMQYTIYAPLTVDPPPPLPGPAYLADTCEALRTDDVPVLNVTEELQAAARAGLHQRHYYYWLDDTHWNKDGVALVARAIAAKLNGTPREQPTLKAVTGTAAEPNRR